MIATIEIDSHALLANTQAIRSNSPGKKIIAVVKANAYGIGMREVVGVLDDVVDAWAVDDCTELHGLRFCTDKDVYVLGYTKHEDLSNMCLLRGIQCVYDVDTVYEINKQAIIIGEPAEVNLKIDALLCRQGVTISEIERLIHAIKSCSHIRLRGVYAHFADLEDGDELDFAHTQLHVYEEALAVLRKHGYSDLETHMSATAGALLQVDSYSHIRLGIGMYGLWPSCSIQKKLAAKIYIQPVVAWKTCVVQVKFVQKGQSIGYGRSYIADKDMKVAVIPQGYSDGYDRLLSNCGEVLISGTRCRVCGRIAMNMFVVDVSHLENVIREDEVVLLGKQGDEEITAEEIAECTQTIPYEVLTRLNPLLQRHVV